MFAADAMPGRRRPASIRATGITYRRNRASRCLILYSRVGDPTRGSARSSSSMCSTATPARRRSPGSRRRSCRAACASGTPIHPRPRLSSRLSRARVAVHRPLGAAVQSEDEARPDEAGDLADLELSSLIAAARGRPRRDACRTPRASDVPSPPSRPRWPARASRTPRRSWRVVGCERSDVGFGPHTAPLWSQMFEISVRSASSCHPLPGS